MTLHTQETDFPLRKLCGNQQHTVHSTASENSSLK